MGGLWGPGRGIESLDIYGQMLYIWELLAPVFIGLKALLMVENGLNKHGNVSFRV